MKTRLLILIFAIAALLVSCATMQAELYVAPDGDSKVQAEETSTIAVKEQSGLQVLVALREYSGSEADFAVSFASVDGGTYQIKENDILIYGGNRQKDEWELLDVWNTAAHLERIRQQENAAMIATGVIGTLALIDAIVNRDSVNYYYGYPYYGYSVSSSSPGFNFTFTALSVIESAIAVDQLYSIYETDAINTMFTDGTVTPENPLSGMVYFHGLDKFPDYKVVYRGNGRNMEFTFSRTDREAIIDPWSDRKTSRLSLNYSYTFGANRHNISLSYYAPKGIGAFMGATFLGEDNFIIHGDIGVSAGFNVKLSPYMWLYGGLEADFKKDNSGKALVALAGMDIVVNRLTLKGGAAYNVKTGKFFGEAGVGFAF